MALCAYYFSALLALILLCGWGTSAKYVTTRVRNAFSYSKASYCDADEIRTWSCDSCSKRLPINITGVYKSKINDMQAFVGVSEDHIVLAFRGSKKFGNWINSLDFTKRDYRRIGCVDCKVHRGFFNSCFSILHRFMDAVEKLVQEHPTYPILVTGHSLGGAVATFAAAELALMQYEGDAKPKIELYTFGAPRVGNQAFADWFARLFCAGGHTAYRIVHNADVVPHTTTMAMGFVHVGEEVWYRGDDAINYKRCKYVTGEDCEQLTVVEDKECSNSLRMPSSVPDHSLYLGVRTSCASGDGL